MTMSDTVMQRENLNTVLLVIYIILSWEKNRKRKRERDLTQGLDILYLVESNLILATLLYL